MFLPKEVIRAKRDGSKLRCRHREVRLRITDRSVGDAQAAAFAMLCSSEEWRSRARCVDRAMSRSGTLMQWDRSDLHGPVVDKHSTGGVGDKVSLMLAPLVAPCGAQYRYLGAGLGHTGGTFASWRAPRLSTCPDNNLFRKVVAESSAAIIGQTSDLAPADGRLYAIRDVTATVESIPLITASILSKKLAAGLDALVMDVTFGNGAFMNDLAQAEELAHSIVAVARGAGLVTTALLTDMNQVLDAPPATRSRVETTIGARTSDRQAHQGAVARRRDLRTAAWPPTRSARILWLQREPRQAPSFPGDVTALGDLRLVAIRSPSAVGAVTKYHAEPRGYVQSMDTIPLVLAVVALGGGVAVGVEIDTFVAHRCLASASTRTANGRLPSCTPDRIVGRCRRAVRRHVPWRCSGEWTVVASRSSSSHASIVFHYRCSAV